MVSTSFTINTIMMNALGLKEQMGMNKRGNWKEILGRGSDVCNSKGRK